jgi:hypothetical protein
VLPAGTRPLLRVTLGQDLRNIAPWVVLISFLSASSVVAYALIFPDPDERARLAVALGGNPALSLLFGPARDLMTSDGFNAWRSGQLGALFAGLMGILVVVRNSRANEDHVRRGSGGRCRGHSAASCVGSSPAASFRTIRAALPRRLDRGRADVRSTPLFPASRTIADAAVPGVSLDMRPLTRSPKESAARKAGAGR